MHVSFARWRSRMAGGLVLAALLPALPGATGVDLDPRPTRQPDRIMLTWSGDPATTQAVTWRTDASVTEAVAELAVATAGPGFRDSVTTVAATTSALETESGLAHYHSVVFTDLRPNTRYVYRVGDGAEHWSEWIQFRTASDTPEPFSFIYVGDAQNEIFSMWSRAIREAYAEAPRARFIIHAGDLVNRAHRDLEWHEWFAAGGWIHRMVPGIPVPGNHEYDPLPDSPDDADVLARQWRHQFTLPPHEIPALDETAYVIDYQGVRIIGLNTLTHIEEQAAWLETVLADNPNHWTVVTFHFPIFSAARGRDNEALRAAWKPLFDRYRVDLVLQGHDHAYGRGHNLPVGVNQRDPEAGTVYVVSVSGPKMYRLSPEADWMDRAAEDTQLYQVIDVTPDLLTYRAMTVTGELYDSFQIVRGADGVKRFMDGARRLGPERRGGE